MASQSIDIPQYADQFVTAKDIPTIETFDPYSCVSYAKWRIEVPQSESWGNAWELRPNATEIAPGEFVLLKEGQGHIAYIESMVGDILLISEYNYIPGKYSTRSLDIHSPDIRGYWKPI